MNLDAVHLVPATVGLHLDRRYRPRACLQKKNTAPAQSVGGGITVGVAHTAVNTETTHADALSVGGTKHTRIRFGAFVGVGVGSWGDSGGLVAARKGSGQGEGSPFLEKGLRGVGRVCV